MQDIDDMPSPIGVTRITDGYNVYGRFGSILRTDDNLVVLYCNIKPGVPERVEMEQALKLFAQNEKSAIIATH